MRSQSAPVAPADAVRTAPARRKRCTRRESPSTRSCAAATRWVTRVAPASEARVTCRLCSPSAVTVASLITSAPSLALQPSGIPPASSASKLKFCWAWRRRRTGEADDEEQRERASEPYGASEPATVAQAERSAGRSGTSGLTSRTSTWNRSRSPSTASRSGGDNHDSASAAVCASPSLARAVMNMISG